MAGTTETAKGSNDDSENSRSVKGGGKLLIYFAIIVATFSAISVIVNTIHHNPEDIHNIQKRLEISKNEFFSNTKKIVQKDKTTATTSQTITTSHQLSGLKCDAYGGPSEEIAKEMVYWEDIPTDNKYVSPFKRKDKVQYMTFEPDRGGWNNIRMAMETVLAMSVAMGRTLVLPPEQDMYLLAKKKNKNGEDSREQRIHFSFAHFFHMESIANEHLGLDVITMTEFLEREGITGRLKDQKTGKVLFPPNNRTNWDGIGKHEVKGKLDPYLRKVGLSTIWEPNDCMAAFPTKPGAEDIDKLQAIKDHIEKKEGGFKSFEAYIGKPYPVDASPHDRMKENWAGRKELCIYDMKMQNTDVIHFPHDHELNARLLVHFYAFLFFEDWKQDLWMKRFVRDHVRYIDEIQCAAARVVHAIRKRAIERDPTNNPTGIFDTFHIRRGDFQYKVTRFDADKIYEMSKDELVEGTTVYVATDERDKSFFKPLADKYDIVFLDDFVDEIKELNTNYYGMVDQLIASRGRTFFGCWFSTFTGYINRLRGYHADNQQLPGYEDGIVKSYYYALEDRKFHMQTFYPVKREYYAREFPASWRNIDQGISELAEEQQNAIK